MKSFITKVALEEQGHLVLLAIFDSVDDTKLVQKGILEVRLQLFYLIYPKNLD